MSRKIPVSRKLLSCVAPGALALGLAAAHPAPAEADNDARVRRVLLISIDGMHSVDFINCANGISGANGGKPSAQSRWNSKRPVSTISMHPHQNHPTRSPNSWQSSVADRRAAWEHSTTWLTTDRSIRRRLRRGMASPGGRGALPPGRAPTGTTATTERGDRSR